MKRTRVFIVRHGAAGGVRPGAFIGQIDPPLSDEGAARMETVAISLARVPVKKVYSSPLARCLESARIVGRRLGLAPIVHEGLKEVSLGEWEGLTLTEIAERFPEEAGRMRRERVGFVHPGGESIEEMASRARKACEEIVVRSEGEDVAVVGHGGVNRAILAAAMDMPVSGMFRLHQDEGCVSVVEVAGGYPMIRLLNAPPGPVP